MKITYDEEVDAMYIYLKQGVKIHKTKPISNDYIIDLDKKGSIIGIEILSASKHVPKKLIDSSYHFPVGIYKTVTV